MLVVDEVVGCVSTSMQCLTLGPAHVAVRIQAPTALACSNKDVDQDDSGVVRQVICLKGTAVG